MTAHRDPSANPTPLDLASFYIEELKYGPGPGKIVEVDKDRMVAELEVLLRDAGVSSMSGLELCDATEFYARSLSRSFGIPVVLAGSIFFDGLMHGIALAAGLEGPRRNPRAVGE